jgi:dTDP-4-dehydrorhamnose reductase
MKILLLGKTGQVGGALTPLLRQLAGSSADEALVTLGRADVDLSDAVALAQAVQQVQPSLIVNAAAHTAVDRAETEPDIAFAINAIAPGVLAQQAAKLNALLVHYSTDYVFDGSFKTITISKTSLTKNDVIKIVTDFNSDYRIVDNSIVFDECSETIFSSVRFTLSFFTPDIFEFDDFTSSFFNNA